MDKYLRLDLPAKTRLTILHTLASAHGKPTWREARRETFLTVEPFFANGKEDIGSVWGVVPVIVSFQHPDYYGWRMVYADEIQHTGIDHTGWFQDEHCSRGTVRGIVIRLAAGRFMAGYVNQDNGEYVIFRERFTDARKAAQWGDRQAQRVAEDESAHNRRYDEARDMEDRREQIEMRLKELQVLIESGQFENASSEAARLTAEAASITDKLNNEYNDVL